MKSILDKYLETLQTLPAPVGGGHVSIALTTTTLSLSAPIKVALYALAEASMLIPGELTVSHSEGSHSHVYSVHRGASLVGALEIYTKGNTAGFLVTVTSSDKEPSEAN